MQSIVRVVLSGALLAPAAVHAQVVFSDLGKNLEFQQTGATTVSAANGGTNAFFFARSFYNNPSDFDGGVLTFPGPGSPQNFNLSGLLDCCGHFGRGYQTGFLTPADMDFNFPTGVTYTLTSTNSITLASQSVDINFAQDLFSTEIPTFSAATFSGLQNVTDPGAGMTIDFNSFVADPSADFSQGFFSIFDFTSGTTVANFAGFANTTTSLFLAANTLTAGHTYVAELIFDQGVDASSETAYRSDNRTRIDFQVPLAAPTSTPEPSTWIMMLTGLGLLGATRLRTRRQEG